MSLLSTFLSIFPLYIKINYIIFFNFHHESSVILTSFYKKFVHKKIKMTVNQNHTALMPFFGQKCHIFSKKSLFGHDSSVILRTFFQKVGRFNIFANFHHESSVMLTSFCKKLVHEKTKMTVNQNHTTLMPFFGQKCHIFSKKLTFWAWQQCDFKDIFPKSWAI